MFRKKDYRKSWFQRNAFTLWILCGFTALVSQGLSAPQHQDFYTQHAQGWHWYHNPTLNPKQPRRFNQAQIDAHPVAAMKAQRLQLTRALDRAILNPTQSNITRYMVLQQHITHQATDFSNGWVQVLIHKPQLDYGLKHPTSSLGRQIYLSQQTLKQTKTIKDFARHYGLFFFYRGDCPYCHHFAPILKAVSQTYHIQVLPITVGRGMLPQYPNSVMNHGQAEQLGVKVYPALFAVNLKTHAVTPLAYGLMSEEALERRIVLVANELKTLHEEKS